MTTSDRSSVRVEIDQAAGVAYIALTDADVVRTIDIVEDEIMIDLDAYDMAVGIEVLSTSPVVTRRGVVPVTFKGQS